MALADNLERGFNLGYKSSKFAPLGDAIRSTIQAYSNQNTLESGLAAKAGMERLFQDPVEQRYKQAQTRLAESSADLYDRYASGGSGEGMEGEDIASMIDPNESPEDYYLKPTMVRGPKGIQQRTLVPTRKKDLTADEENRVNATQSLIGILDRMDKLLDTGKIKSGTTAYQYGKGFGADAISAQMSPEEQELRQLMTEAQGQYLTAKTGSQRGFPEIQWLMPAMPNDKNLIFGSTETFRNMIKNTKRASMKQYSDLLGVADRTNRAVAKHKAYLNEMGLNQDSGGLTPKAQALKDKMGW